MTTPNIVILSSLDTKATEAKYLSDCIEAQGANVIVIDIGYGRPAKMAATYSASKVAQAAGSDIDEIYGIADTSIRSDLMMQGAAVLLRQLLTEGRCDGVVSFGGASNTTLATSIMKTLPIGIPKMVISSAAAMPTYSAMYFGSRDITIMHSVVDLSGLNDLTRAFLQRGAGGIVGMAAASDGQIDPSGGAALIAVTSFRFAENCCQAAMRELVRRGYTPIPFHAQGVGENAMENLVAQGIFAGVLDVVPAGLSEEMLGGNRAARPDRLEGAGRLGIPQVVAVSGFDMISCGPLSRRDRGDPLWEANKWAERKMSKPDRFRVEVRTTAQEVAKIAHRVAEKLKSATGPAAIYVPLKGWSTLSVDGAELFDPEADAAFLPALKASLGANTKLVEMDTDLNSESFAHAMVDTLLDMIENRESWSNADRESQ
jgi:uncharacterized protein (UPF0261 family)